MPDTHHTRRRFVGITAAIGTAALAGCMHGDEEGPEDPVDDDGDDNESDDGGDSEAGVDDWLQDANNYDDVEDMTGEEEVTVEVGVGDEGYAFGPAAVQVDTGTTVMWEWTGEGGAHDVTSNDDSDFDFDSGDPAEDDEFEHTFEDAGTGLYFCTPHQTQGMKGAVVVE